MAAEQALQRYCSPDLVKEYESLGSNEKKNMLKALVTNQQQHLINHSVPAKMQKGNVMKNKNTQKISCPLAQALVEVGVQKVMVQDNEIMDKLRMKLRNWGHKGATGWLAVSLNRQRMEYMKNTADYKQVSEQKEGGFYMCMRSTNSSVVKSSSSCSVQWHSLKKIDICDMKLFGASKGCYLEAKIVVEPIRPMVGSELLVQDSRGEYIRVVLYNILPDGVRGVLAEPLLKSKFPEGKTIRIAEPFLKIFQDDSRGVRVDNPFEVQVDTDDVSTKKQAMFSDEALVTTKNQGNDLFAMKKYIAAMDVYMSALKTTEFIPTVLSNRSQAYIFLEEWELGLLDAAASLTIKPDSPKTWKRYSFCIEKLQQCKGCMDNHSIMEAVLRCKSPFIEEFVCCKVDAVCAGQLKQQGNDAFAQKNYQEAVGLYTKALLEAGATVRALLGNWALCSLEVESYNDSLAAAMASLRIGMDEKVVYRLCTSLCYVGEHKNAINVLSMFPKSSNLKYLQREAKASLAFIGRRENAVTTLSQSNIPSLVSTWIGPVEVYMTEKMGRGIRSTRDIRQGEIILAERFLARSDGGLELRYNTANSSCDDASSAAMISDLVHRCQNEAVLSIIISNLADGTKQRQLTTFDTLSRTINSSPALLPARFDYATNEKKLHTFEAIGAVVRNNIFGSKRNATTTTTTSHQSEAILYASISMMNHANEPNCAFVSYPGEDKGIAFIATTRPIPKGQELFIQYHDDEKIASTSWKF